MNYFVLFSVLLIAACVVILLVPLSNPEEGFATHEMRRRKHPISPQPAAAGQRNASSHAGSADGTSDHDHLLDTLLLKHDKLAEAFENRQKPGVSSTTTKKKGIASTGASYKGDEVSIPVAGCNSDKCVEIGKTQPVFDPMAAIDGNCVNPMVNNEPDYSTKYCPAFKPKDTTIDAQECLTCGYYKYMADCLKYADPKNPTKCTLHGNYKYNQPPNGATYYSGPMPGQGDQGGGGGQGGGGDQGSTICSASTCGQKTVTVDGTQCIIPGCVSNDGGMMPYPNDFYGNITINPCYPIKDSTGATSGFMCPAITSGEMYDMGGGSTDLCYTTNGVVDHSKFFKIDTVCSNDKQKSEQQFKPENVDGNDGSKRKRTASKTGSAIQHQHQHGGAVNVFHHHMHSSGNNGNNGNKGSNGSKGSKGNKNQGYMEPEAGAGVLGFL